MSIVVTGATGQLGHLIVEKLLDRGVAPDEVVATGRSLDRIADLAVRGVRTASFDYADPRADGVIETGDTVLIVSTDVPGDRVALHTGAVQAAVKAGAARLVYTSAPRADDTALVFAPEHAATEQVVRAAGVRFTLLRNNWYTENYAGALLQAGMTGRLVSSAGDGRVASATRADLAAGTAAVLTTDGHDGAVYELGGDTAWDLAELAAAMATVLGRAVTYQRVTPQEHLAVLTGAGLDGATAGFVVALDGNIRDGALAEVTHDLSRLTGRQTTPLTDALAVLV